MARRGRVEGKVAIITGAASGIGRATAETFADEGALVVVADINAEGAKIVADAIVANGGEASAQHVDVGDPGSVEEMVAAGVRRYGSVTVLFNNAADTGMHMMTHDTAVADMTVDVWDHAMAVDLRSAMLGAKYAIPHMIEAGGGSIIHTSSNQALAGDLTQTAYAAAKAGIISLSRSIATQYGAYGIRSNVVSPGAILTPAFERACPPEFAAEIATHSPIARLGRAADLAATVLFLASDESAYVTGQTISVDGGQLAHLPHYS